MVAMTAVGRALHVPEYVVHLFDRQFTIEPNRTVACH